MRTLAWSNTESGLRESPFSWVRSYPPQRTHHVPSLCQGPSERQVSGLCCLQKLASGVAHAHGDERVLKVKPFAVKSWVEIHENSRDRHGVCFFSSRACGKCQASLCVFVFLDVLCVRNAEE